MIHATGFIRMKLRRPQGTGGEPGPAQGALPAARLRRNVNGQAFPGATNGLCCR